MPRATRRSLAGGDSAAPSQSRSRTPAAKSPKATAASAPSPKSPRGKGKEEEKAAESKRQGRSTSRGKAVTATSEASPAATKASRSRSRSAPSKGKQTPTTPARRGRGKATAEEEEEEEVKPKRARDRGQSAGKSPQRKGRSPAKAAAPSKGKAKSPGKAAASTSRTAKSPAARKAKSPAAPTKGKGKSPAKAAASAKRQSKSPAKAAATRSPRTPAVKTANKKKEAKKFTPRSQARATPPSRGSKSPRTPAAKAEKKIADAKSSPRGRGGTASASTPKSRSRRSQEPAEAEEEVQRNTEEEIETTELQQEKEQEKSVDEEMTKSGEDDAKMEEDKDDTKTDSRDENLADKNSQKEKASEIKDVSASMADLAEEKEVSENKDSLIAEKTAPVEKASPEKAQSSAAEKTEEPMEDKNGEADSTIPSPRCSAAVKRKFEEVSEETEDGPSTKQARVNGAEREEGVDKDSTPSGAEAKPEEEELLKDYVVVNKEEVPAADSSEVAASFPVEHEESIPEPMETEKAGPSGSDPVFLVPLTQMEVIKACAYGDENQAECGDGEDASSITVEVGSLASSEMSSRQLDMLDTLSAANSVDGDRVASEGNLDDSMDDPDKESEAIPPTADPSVVAEVKGDGSSTSSPADPVIPAGVSSSFVPTKTTDAPVSAEPVGADSSVNNSSSAQSAGQPDPATGHLQSDRSVPPQPPVLVETAADSVQSSVVQSAGPSTTEGSKVTASLGSPAPVVLSACSSTGLFSRAYVPNPAFSAGSVAPDRCFSLVSYNVLAECNRQKADYSYTGEEFLVQEYRHGLLLKELQHLDGDLVCLQEVSPHYFNTTLLPAMKGLGYDGMIMRRTKDVFDEGEATFFKTSLFEMEASQGVSLSEVAFKEVEKGGVSEEVGASLKKYLDRAEVVLITRLRHKATGRVVTVGNIHVIWGFSLCPDVQCIQIACAIKEVVDMSGSGGAHIVCGDFNSECASPAYQMVLDGSLSEASITALQAINNLQLENGAKSLVSHLRPAFQHTSTPLRSAYFTVTKSEPEITSLTSFMEGAVDYQFYSSDSLVPVGVLKTVDKGVIKATGGLPSKDFPSDHLSLKSVMTFCK